MKKLTTIIAKDAEFRFFLSINMTSVVNVKVANIRPKYKDLETWMADPENIYIGRRGIVFIDKVRFPKTDSLWANPFKIGKDKTREDVLKEYEVYIREKIKREDLWSELEKLRGKHLGCWCKPEDCHGDILVKLLEERDS